MLSQVEQDAAAVWMHEPSTSWSDDLSSLLPLAKRDALFGSTAEGLLDKVNDDKLARDVEDLSTIFQELEEGMVDFPLPCDEDDVETGADVTGDWIGDLDKDVVNVDDLSSMFDALAAEQESALDAEEKGETSFDEDAMDESDEDEDDEEEVTRSVQMVPAAPTWASMAPLDPRSVIRTPIYKDLDSRIPRVEIPRIDLGFGARFTLKPVTPVRSAQPNSAASPKPCEQKKTAVLVTKDCEYHHDDASCWICKSDKSPYKKFALHRYLEKRHRRNWKRGPRYSGRSHVATNRVRAGGRFVTTAHWV